MDLSDAAWRKSSWSSANGCVEVAFIEDQIALRDSKDPDGPVLVFTAHEWASLLGKIRNGELERPR